jgi:myo-inositol-1(or 4)-monophosphatase
MSSEFQTAIQVAKSAGQVLCNYFQKPHQVTYKGVIDIVTEIDCQSESLICNLLKEAYPQYGFLGEENGEIGGSEQGLWIVDPLDGTTNYAKGYPFFAVSIALEKNHEIVLGVVYNPLTNELFAAERGLGASLNGQAIYVSKTSQLALSLLASGFPYDVRSSQLNNFYEWQQFLQRTISVRCDGSASLDLCHVAAGHLDGFWEYGLDAWDMAAGALIVEEAGGKISSISGTTFSLYQKSILATNQLLHPDMLKVINLQPNNKGMIR